MDSENNVAPNLSLQSPYSKAPCYITSDSTAREQALKWAVDMKTLQTFSPPLRSISTEQFSL